MGIRMADTLSIVKGAKAQMYTEYGAHSQTDVPLPFPGWACSSLASS